MKKLNRIFGITSAAVITTAVIATLGASLGASRLSAQDTQPAPADRPDRPNRQNIDPEQMRQRMMDRYREQMEVKDDAEWKVISERIEKVTKARREAGSGGGGGFAGFGRGGPGGPPAAGAPGGGGGGGGRRGGFGAEPLPEFEALQKAIEGKASNDELKTKLAKLRDARKDKEAKLEKEQDDLRKILSVRQEAAAVVAGILK